MAEQHDHKTLATTHEASEDEDGRQGDARADGRYLFGRLDEHPIDRVYTYAHVTQDAHDPPDVACTTSDPRDTDTTDTDQDPVEDTTREVIEAVFHHVEQWVTVVQDRWQRHVYQPRFLTEFQGNMRFLLRLLRGNRFPRLALIGRRGAGKSSLINAILGECVATPGHLRAQTGNAKILMYRLPNGSGIDVLDTRGLNEGGKPEESDSAETATDSIVKALEACPVDCILFLHKAKEVDAGIEQDLRAFDEILRRANLVPHVLPQRHDADQEALLSSHEDADHTPYGHLLDTPHAARNMVMPIIGVLTHVDELAPSDLRRPTDYDDEKRANIRAACDLFRRHFARYVSPATAAQLVGVEGVSAAVIWQSPDADGRRLPHPRRDYRYKIGALMHVLLRNCHVRALFRLAQAARVGRVKRAFAEYLVTRVFASLAAVLAWTPLPGTDVVPIVGLQVLMVYAIATLARNAFTYDMAVAFFGVVGFTGAVGFGLRFLSSQLFKLVPGFGTAPSAAMTYGITVGLGKAAIAFYMDEKDEAHVRQLFERTKLEAQTRYAHMDENLENVEDEAG